MKSGVRILYSNKFKKMFLFMYYHNMFQYFCIFFQHLSILEDDGSAIIGHGPSGWRQHFE